MGEPPAPPHPPSNADRIDLVERLPLLVGDAQRLGRLDGALHVARPHLQLADALAPDEFGQGLGVLRRWG